MPVRQIVYDSLKSDAKEMNFYFRPVYKNATFLGNIEEEIPAIKDSGSYIKINNILSEPEYKVRVTFN